MLLPFLLRCTCVVSAALAILSWSSVLAQEPAPGFRRIHDTVSPNGAYVLGWGWGHDPDHLDQLKEWAPKKDTAGEEEVANFIIDATAAKPLHLIPERDYYITSEGNWKQFSGLSAGWADDSSQAMAIYEGRWSDEGVCWIFPKEGTVIDILGDLDEIFRNLIIKKYKLEDAGEISFSMPVLLTDGILVIDALAMPKINEPPHYSYRLKVQLKRKGEEATLRLLSSRLLPQKEDGEEELEGEKQTQALEAELNTWYQKLRAKLGETAKADLKTRQLQWLKLREAMPEDSDRQFYTRLRIAHLRARVEYP